MRSFRRNSLIGVVVAMIAVVLPAGVLAATTGGAGLGGDGRAGATGFGVEPLHDTAPDADLPLASVAAPPAPPTSILPTPGPPTTTTTRPAATTNRPPSTSARPTGTTTTTLPPSKLNGPLAPAAAWSATHDGVTARMRIEPAAPLAGEPVTFFIDEVKASSACCFVLLVFGDMKDAELGPNPTCASPTTRTGVVATHTYAAPGTYRVLLATATVGGCASGEPVVRGAPIEACVAVGPGVSPDAMCPALPSYSTPAATTAATRPPAA
jgi:hypothetical protein